jgi:uncharacterized membrane protein YedE/YeeE
MARMLSAALAGLLFGVGLLISGMADPSKVLGFLDLAGRWNPSLAFVMAAAVATAALGSFLARRLRRPLLAPRFEIPTRRDIDGRLIVGAAIFGLGWGLVGLCPGPALVDAVTAPAIVLPFVAAMIVGMALHRLLPVPAGASKLGQADVASGSDDA